MPSRNYQLITTGVLISP